MSEDEGPVFRFLHRIGVPEGMEQLVLTFGTVAIFGIAFAAYWFGERVRVARGGMSDDTYVVIKWGSDAPIPVDVNGDGVEDIVGVYVGKPRGRYLGAFNGVDKKPLWRFGPIDIATAVAGGLPQFGKQGDLLLLHQKRQGTVLNVHDGKPTAKFPLPNARLVCAGETPTSPLVLGTTSRRPSVASGHLRPALRPRWTGRRVCQRSMAHARQTDVATLGDLAQHKQSWALVDGTTVVGVANGPTTIPTAYGFSGEEREPKWQTVLLPSAKPGALVLGSNHADLAGGRAFIGYWSQTDKKQWVLALDAKTGKELWRSPIDSPGSFMKSVSASENRVYVVVGDYLVVLDAKTGKVVLDLGVGDDE